MRGRGPRYGHKFHVESIAQFLLSLQYYLAVNTWVPFPSHPPRDALWMVGRG